MNCYEAMKRMLEIDSKMFEISKLLSSAKNPSDIERYDKNIDILEEEFLNLKHQLELTELNTKYV